MEDLSRLKEICKLVRYGILTSTSEAGSGHPTSSLSAVELTATLFFGGYFRQDLENPRAPYNDRFILSKGHASPLLYSLYHLAGKISQSALLTLRKFGSTLEGHPRPNFQFADVATGSLGQGLSIGVGMSLALRQKSLKDQRIFVLMGDSEIAEGQVWEAMQIASYYKLNNLTAIVDVNRLGQRGETMLGWDVKTHANRAEAFGWKSITIDDGHDLKLISDALKLATTPTVKPTIIIAKTIKGKGVSFLEDKDDWHGKAIPKERLEEALRELGEVDLNIRGKINKPNTLIPSVNNFHPRDVSQPQYKQGDLVATRQAYGDSLCELGQTNDKIICFDAEVSNSTYANRFAKDFPDRFFEMFIAEQNMISVSLGLEMFGFIAVVTTFSAFFSRAFDQLRMAQYSDSNIKCVGSHAGVFLGSDGPSQMGLEDIAMMRSLLQSTVLQPSDAVSSFKLSLEMIRRKGIVYLRTTRDPLPVIYDRNEEFPIGGAKILRSSPKDKAIVIASGVTVHEALKASEILEKEGVFITVIDLYSIKPIDEKLLTELSRKKLPFVVIEDHYPFGGIGETVKGFLANDDVVIHHLAVNKIPRSGKPEELLAYEEIDANTIIKKIKSIT